MASKDKAAKRAPKKKNGYEAPKHLKAGSIITDNFKKSWKIGVSIGVGGFGEIYSACDASSSIKKVEDYPFVVKIEPHSNGPLFVEMHFYMRNAKNEDIEKFKKERKLKTLGMPIFIGSGSHEIEDVKHRFLVMPRYGKDIWKIFLEHNRLFPLHTVYRIGWQLTNILEYIHQREYVHMDIKGANILLGFGPNGNDQIYLLDFGLACHYNTKVYKVDPKKAHNGTIEYTSRDAHNGVPTMRGDIEILAYNIIEWAGAKLPWTSSASILQKPAEVQKLKENFMKDIEKSLKSAFGSLPVPSHLISFMKYVETLKHNDTPDYKKIRGIFESGLKELKQSNTGKLDFLIKSSEKAAKSPLKRAHTLTKDTQEKPNKQPRILASTTETTDDDKKKKSPVIRSKRGANERKRYVETESDEDMEEIKAKKTEKIARKEVRKAKKSPEKLTNSPEKNENKSKRYVETESDEDLEEIKAKKTEKIARKEVGKAKKSPEKNSPEKNENKSSNKSSPSKKSKDTDDKKEKVVASTKGSVVLKSASGTSKKTVQLNFDLDISFDSDLVVTVNRKNKKTSSGENQEKKEESEKFKTQAGFYKGKYAKPN